MAIDAAVLRARVEVEGIQQAQAQLQGFGAQIGTVGNQAKTAGSGVTQLGGAADAAGKKVAGAGKQTGLLNTVMGDMSAKSLLMSAGLAGVGLQAANMGKAAVTAAIDWESSLAGIAKTLDTTGLSVEEADAAVVQMGNDIRQMATEIPIAATELAGVAEAAGQLGIARQDVVAFTETMAKLGVATDLTAEQAATSIARIANITGLATEDVDNFGAALVDLGNNSAASESEILAMATRIAAAGEIAGLTEGEILGLSAALTSVGINAEAGGTAITQVMNEIETSVESADDRLATFAEIAGMSAEAFATAWRESPNEALVSFVEGLGDVTTAGGSTVQILDELGLDGIRVSQALNSAAGAGDLMRESMDRGNTAMEENVALNKEAEQRFKTTASQVQILKNNINELNLVLADGYLPAMNEGIGLTTLWVSEIRNATTITQDFQTNMRGLATSIGDYLPEIEIAGSSTGEFGGALREAIINITPGIGVMQSINEAFGFFGDTTAETTELTKAQTTALREWITVIEGGIPGIQSENEWTNRLADNQIRLRDASRETMQTHVELTEAQLAAAEGQRIMTQEGHRGVQMATELGVVVNDLDRTFEDLDTTPLVTGLQNFGEMQELFQQNIENASIGVSEWEGHLSGAEKALGFLQEKIDEGRPLTEEQQQAYDDLTWASERYKGGIEDEAEALIDAEVAKANFVKIQDELNAALEAGEITQDEYNEAIGTAAAELDPATAASMGLLEAQGLLAEGIDGTITKLVNLLVELGVLDETEAEAIVGADTTEAEGNVDHMEGRLETYEGIVSTATADVDDSSAVARIDGVEGELTAYAGATWTTTVTADVSAAEAEIARIKSIISSGAILPVAISASDVESGFASGTGPSGTTRNQLAWVGEQGPELAWLPEGTHILPNDESRKFAALMGQIPGFQDGTGGGGPQQGTIPISGEFVSVGINIGEQISAGIQMALDLGILDAAGPTGEEIAAAMIDGAVKVIESDAEGVADQFVVDWERVPELAGQIGHDAALGLMQDWADLQGELQLAILSGEDTTEIEARLKAIEALITVWGGNVVGEVVSVGDAMEAALDMERFTGLFDMPGGAAPFDLDEILSGGALDEVRAEFQELFDLQRIAQELGYDEFAAELGQRMKELGLQEEMLEDIIGTDFGQQMAEKMEAEEAAKIAAEEFAEAWNTGLDAAFSDNPVNFAENVQDQISDLEGKIDLAPVLGIPADIVAGWQEELGSLQGEQDAFWQSLAEGIASGLIDPAVLEELDEAGKAQLNAYLTPIIGEEGVERIFAGFEEVNAVTAEGLDQLRTLFEQDSEAAAGSIDDLIQAAIDGSITWADAMSLMANVPQDELIPTLEDLERKFKDDLSQAILGLDEDAQAVAEQGLAMVQQALAGINVELGDLMGFSDDFARRATGGAGVITSAGGGGGGSSGGGSSGGGGRSTSTGGATSDPNALIPPPPDDAISYFHDRRMWVQRLGAPAHLDESYLNTAGNRGVNRFYYNPEGGGDEKLRIDFDEAADLLLGTGRMRQFSAFADGGVTLGPSLAILGDNPSGREMVLPFERNQEFAEQIAMVLSRVLGGPKGDIILQVDGETLGRITSGHVNATARSHINQSGIPVGLGRR